MPEAKRLQRDCVAVQVADTEKPQPEKVGVFLCRDTPKTFLPIDLTNTFWGVMIDLSSQSGLKKRGFKMKVTTLSNGKTTDYFYAPEHYEAALEAYTQMVRTGDIETFAITLITN